MVYRIFSRQIRIDQRMDLTELGARLLEAEQEIAKNAALRQRYEVMPVFKNVLD